MTQQPTPLTDEELQHWWDWLERDVPKLVARYKATFADLQARLERAEDDAVTPKMIGAGAHALRFYDREFGDANETAAEVYAAMRKVLDTGKG